MDHRTAPHSHYIDRRASQTAEVVSRLEPNRLLSTAETAELIGYSTQWLEIGRHKGYGPRFIRVGPRRIRYMASDVLAWLEERKHRCTTEYMRKISGNAY